MSRHTVRRLAVTAALAVLVVPLTACNGGEGAAAERAAQQAARDAERAPHQGQTVPWGRVGTGAGGVGAAGSGAYGGCYASGRCRQQNN